MRYYHKISETCYKVISWLAVCTVVAMLSIMCMEVVRRYCFGKTFIWSDEIVRMLLLFCAYFGGAAAYHNHNLTSFDMVTNLLSERVNDILKLICNVILNCFFVFLTYYTYKKMTSPSVAKSVSTSTGLSGSVPYYAIFLGLIFMIIFTIDFYPALISKVIGKANRKEEGKC